MKFRKPSPSMAVSLAALVMASTGTAVAAVNFARNAGAVDHKSAVSASSGLKSAAGKLVATRAKGADAGRLPNRFVSSVPFVNRFSRELDVSDNAQGTPQTLAKTRLGTLTVSCDDQRPATGVEDPKMTFDFTNTSSGPVNFEKNTASGSVQVESVAAGSKAAFTIAGSNGWTVRLDGGGTNVIYDGQTRQDGKDTGSAHCTIAGVSETFAP
jgi:hypothetical protein